MQGLKLTLLEIDSFIKQTKQQQQDQIKGIRNIYKQFISRNQPNFQNVVKRIQTNLKNTTEQSLQNNVYNININEAMERFKQEELKPIDKQIEQARSIIEKGCGTVQKREKDFTLSKTQKMGVDRMEREMEGSFGKTFSGEMKWEDNRENDLRAKEKHSKIGGRKYTRDDQIRVIQIQRWWRGMKPEAPIYNSKNYFD